MSKIAAFHGIHTFMEQLNVRRDLWNKLLTECSFIRGDGYRVGEPITLNSVFLVGSIALNDATSRLLTNLLQQSNLDAYLFLRVQSGALEIKRSAHHSDTMNNGIVAIDVTRMDQIELNLSGSFIFFLVPKSDVALYNLNSSLHGCQLFSQSASSPFFQILDVLVETVRLADQKQLRSCKYAFVGAVVAEFMSAITAREARTNLPERIMRFIEQQYMNRDFSIAVILQEFSISRSHLYRLFAKRGGVREFIRTRRLKRLYDDLLRNGVRQKTLKAMAYDYGFSDGQALKRYFRYQYGFDVLTKLDENSAAYDEHDALQRGATPRQTSL